MSLTVLVIGMGAVGSLYASKLQQAGLTIIALCRSDYDIVQKQGVHITHPNNQHSIFKPKRVIRHLDELKTPVDIVLVCSKVLPVIDSISLLRSLDFKAILLLQNGIFIEDEIYQAFRDKEILSGLAFVCVSRTKPGYVHHQDYGALCIGNYPSGLGETAKRLAERFNSVGTNCLLTDSIMTARFKKLCWNAAFNPLSIIEGELTTAELLATPGLEQRIRRIMKEVQAIAIHTGFGIEDTVIEKHIQDTKKMVAYKTSMLLDWQGNRDIEIEAILGNACHYANKHGLACTELNLLYTELTKKIVEKKNV
jgi:2-dehydropantoate 2-reductase